ncbi:hypothetical protein GBAR_LOCUS19015 [Geodia barretti]|uniref:Uncharacterized protein n=1 Tax=Geodia barretti TaxID=519541 RepID=A0AA35WTZ5_GEOBA|nr:hypothetical protein GBAR_LOCUS19015 [Geodia barretti]
MALRFAFLLAFLCLGAFVCLSQGAAIKEIWEDYKEDEKSSSLESSGRFVEEEEGDKTDPRLHRKKRQILYPTVFSTRRSRRRSRLAYPYLYSYYNYPYNYPYYSYQYYPYAPFYTPGVLTGFPPTTTTNVPLSAAAATTTTNCGCTATDINCLTTCYYNQYLQG